MSDTSADPTYQAFEALVALREGRRNVVYLDPLGNPTGGIGHLIRPADNLGVGWQIPDAVIDAWFKVDGAKAYAAAQEQCAEAGITNADFLAVLGSVNYQLGTAWTAEFPNTWRMIVNGRYDDAAMALTDTRWYRQTPVRVADFQAALRALSFKPKEPTPMTSTNVPPLTPPTPTPAPPLISSSPANQATAAGSGGAAAAIIVVVMWGLGLLHITVPPEVASAMTALVGAGVHALVIKYSPPSS